MASTDTSAREDGGFLARMGRHADVVVGVLLIVIGIATIIESRGFPATAVGTDIGAGAFPTAFAYILIVLCLLQIFNHFTHTGQDIDAGDAAATSTRPNYLVPFLGVVLTVLYVALIHWTGYLASTPIYMFVLLRVIKFRARMASVLIALGVTIALYLIFDVGMGVALPPGELFD
ncbi:tripartite tricarboxylate transporter TctB family protein [Propionivibrio sp.]|uniref:tripartite tricarboxylate transporter TctB family protein n=1 Tax=Propionivibrio sp. TaxID=2212460 RepID=UPI0039E2832F